jgi:hypothetical protein
MKCVAIFERVYCNINGVIGTLFDIKIISYMLINQANITNICNGKAIILQLFYTVDLSKILLPKVAVYQLKNCQIIQGLYRELQSLHFTSLTPLTTKHCDRNMLTVVPIIEIFVF